MSVCTKIPQPSEVKLCLVENYEELIQKGEILDNGETSGIPAWLVEVSPGSFNIIRIFRDMVAFYFADSESKTETMNKWAQFNKRS